MRSATDWFDLYGESHQNPTNKTIHWICIPAIFVSTLGLLQSIQLGPINAAMVGATLGLAFYLRLSWTIFAGMAVVLAASFAINAGIVAAGLPLVGTSLAVFAVAWVAQFIGHKIEGAKPSFFEDVQFLLVGPAWLLQFVYRQVGIPVETWGTRAAA
jgi:uncharacterized membrane protein YGL010W